MRSQLYRVQIASSIRRAVKASDAVAYPLRLAEILPSAEMEELLRHALVLRHFRDGKTRPDLLVGRGPSQESLIVDLEAMVVSTSFEDPSLENATSESRRQRALHEILREVYLQALEHKAERLGEIQEAREGRNADGHLELVLKIRLESPASEVTLRMQYDLETGKADIWVDLLSAVSSLPVEPGSDHGEIVERLLGKDILKPDGHGGITVHRINPELH